MTTVILPLPTKKPAPPAWLKWLRETLTPARQFLLLCRDTLVQIGSARREQGAIVQQMYAMGVQSLLFITVTIGFLGMILVYQVATQVEKILPDFSMIGAAFIQIMIKEFAPTIAGMMIATRVGSGIAAEIGSMVVTEQVDALRMCNADPVNYLIVPRFLATVPPVNCEAFKLIRLVPLPKKLPEKLPEKLFVEFVKFTAPE